jgi:hypothetical protein
MRDFFGFLGNVLSHWVALMLIQVNRRQEPYGTLDCPHDFSIETPLRITPNTSGVYYGDWFASRG